MLRVVGSLGALLLGMSVMLLGNGLFGTLTALRMTIENFSPATIGVVVACHSIGFAAACLTCGRVIRRVGHIRVFAAFAATLAFCCLCFPAAVDPAAWIPLRLVFGYAGASCFMVGESWLAGAAPRDMKGKVFAVYMVINKASFGIGQLFLILGDPAGDRLFMLAAALYALCLVPIALTRAKGPDALGHERLSFAALYRLSPVGVAGAITAGFTNASLVGLGPVFATNQGLNVAQVSLFMVAFLAGNLVLQVPIGRTSDRFDRRTVLFVVAVLTAGSCIAMAMAPSPGFGGLLALSALVGGFSAVVYPIAMTHATDLSRPQQTVSLHAGMLLAFSMGASTGPILASLAMQWMGGGGLFAFAAVINVLLAIFILYRKFQRASAPDEQQTDFIAMPQTTQTTQAMAGLDPRADGEKGAGAAS
ncbi:MAG: MFS transporter [Alphaproteobacteria bacterium]|nr:MFS transporter [Alphaproteobacteria bacterium]